MKASEKICDVLIEAGIDYVFGIPGGGTIPVWDALFDRQDRIKAILTRHEQSAACMADLHGRMTGKPAVLMGQGGFIATSGGFGIVEAFLSNSPMLILTDTSDAGFSQHGNYQSGTGEYGSWDIVNILRSMCKYTTYAVTPGEAVYGVQMAIKHATTGNPGPCAVVWQSGAITAEVDPTKPPRLYSTPGYLTKSGTAPLTDDIEDASLLLLQAERPVIIAGNGVHLARAYEELKQLAEFIGAPVATSSTGKSSFPEVHPLAAGMMGIFGQSVANKVIADADVLLVAGCRLSPNDTGQERLINPLRQKIIQIDIEPRNTGWNFPVEMGLIGDLKVVMSQMLVAMKGMEGQNDVRVRERIEALGKIKSKESFFEAAELHSDASPLLPQRIVSEIEKAVSPETIITLDAGNNRLWMCHFFRSKAAGTIFFPGGLAGMGWSPPAALAAKLLHPDRPVLSVSSDGGFAMMTHVLSTALQYHLPVAFLVMNNSGLGMVHDGQKGRYIATEFIPTDFAQIARAFGCQGVRVEKASALGGIIQEALAAKVPTVIDVVTSLAESHLKIANW
ncbi:MAG: acetolactate synthase [Dehalococcoidales bacterium]|nr:acetolactate synthase [Dehalococcoidales bacterium]